MLVFFCFVHNKSILCCLVSLLVVVQPMISINNDIYNYLANKKLQLFDNSNNQTKNLIIDLDREIADFECVCLNINNITTTTQNLRVQRNLILFMKKKTAKIQIQNKIVPIPQ